MGLAAAAVKEAPLITEHHSLQLTRNLLRIAIFHISYIRGLFPEQYFRDTNVPSLDMKVKKLLPMDLESRRLIDWMEKGVYDALKMKYLKTMLFILCAGEDGPAIEEYSFSFDYSPTSEEMSIHMAKNGRLKKTLKTGSGSEMNQEQMRKSACKMMRTLVTLMRTLDSVPEERTILVKLYYFEDLTPAEYEPPFFRSCTFDNRKQWCKSPFCMKAGEVNSEFITFSLKVKSTLDPCGDEVDQDSTCAPVSSSGTDASKDSLNSENAEEDCDSRGNEENADVPASKLLTLDDATDGIVEDDDLTQDVNQEMANLEMIKEWIGKRSISTLHITDVLANFPDISEQHTEELLVRMVNEGFLVYQGKDNYKIKKQETKEDADYYEVETEQPGTKCVVEEKKEDRSENSLYLKALYYTLTMEYITMTHLRENLDENVNLLATRRFIERMVNEGYVEGTAVNRKIGRRVIHSEKASAKLEELRNYFNPSAQLIDQVNQRASAMGKLNLESPASFDLQHSEKLKETHTIEDMDVSTCGALQSFGSELTRYAAFSPTSTHKGQMGTSSDHKMSKRTNSRESHLKTFNNDEILSQSKRKLWSKKGFQFCGSQETCNNLETLRKASIVEEPIYQHEKRICRDTRSTVKLN
ncbi:hypothetical protein KP509_23G082500 [Ceratopteris richardii]|uniref:HORMA domain-containing protein n=1 Tax=Ceratopteris richardii TaxID=49495 RepID=A0A8T2S4V7_CERRI|nr:hypothetical protein KP509_23G082500 [Ceratopteris richardii]